MMPLECEICGFEHGWLDVDDEVGEIMILCPDCAEKYTLEVHRISNR